MPEADDAVEMVMVDGVSLAVRRSGHGSPVICLTALGHDAEDYGPLVDRLGDRFELIRIEWPGHGRSAGDAQPADARRYAQLLAGVLEMLDVSAPILIGNSIGGAAALIHTASGGPVRGLVLCNSGGLVKVSADVAALCRLFSSVFAAGARGAPWYPALFAAYYRLVLPSPAAAIQRRRIIARAREIAGVLSEGWASFGRADADLSSQAAAVTVPVWVAWARRDRVIPLSRCRDSIARFPDARLTLFDGGHTAFLEDPDAFADAFAAFAADLPAR